LPARLDKAPNSKPNPIRVWLKFVGRGRNAGLDKVRADTAPKFFD